MGGNPINISAGQQTHFIIYFPCVSEVGVKVQRLRFWSPSIQTNQKVTINQGT